MKRTSLYRIIYRAAELFVLIALLMALAFALSKSG